MSNTTALSVNLNKIALLRNSRDTDYPRLTDHARACIEAGADGITVHPRPDQRHIRAADCYDLMALLDREQTGIELNIEGNPFAAPMQSQRRGVSDYPGFIELVNAIKPAQCTLVPDSNEQLTSDHGFDLQASGEKLLPVIEALKSNGIRVSLFMDPDPEQIALARQVGADRIELYTGPYAKAFASGSGIEEIFRRFWRAAEVAAEQGLGLNAGHDLNLDNLPRFASVPGLLEVSIGHALTVDAIHMGLANAIAAYQRCLGKSV